MNNFTDLQHNFMFHIVSWLCPCFCDQGDVEVNTKIIWIMASHGNVALYIVGVYAVVVTQLHVTSSWIYLILSVFLAGPRRGQMEWPVPYFDTFPKHSAK